MPAPVFTSNPAEFTRLEGLYVNEQQPPGFIRGVSLANVGIFGPTVRGPVDQPIVITSEARFLEVFGGRDFGGGGALVNKVWKALLNKPFGRLTIVRAANSADLAASFTCEDGTDGTGTAIIRVDASSPGLWGNSVKIRVENATDGDANHFNLVVSLNGEETTYENLDTTTGNDNLSLTVGDDAGRLIDIVKLADGRPGNFAAFTGDFATALDANGFINLGQTVTGFTSVAGTTGALVAADYTGAGRAIEQMTGLRDVGVVFTAEDTLALVTAINTAIITAAASTSDKLFLIDSGDLTDSVTDVVAYQATLNRSDRVVHCYNGAYTLDPETGLEVLTSAKDWMAAILSQTDVDIHPGEEATKQFTAGITRLVSPALVREDYVSLREAGISALEAFDGFAFVSGVTTSLTPGLEEITRRRQTDFLQLSASNRLKFFVKKRNRAQTRRGMNGELVAFSRELQQSGRIVEEFVVDGQSANTQTSRGQGLEFIEWRVRLIGHILFLVLRTEIGTGVTTEVGLAAA